MKIAVASGKGGTGKTTVATSLALALERADTLFLDCDVEAPNAHLFLRPEMAHRKEVGLLVPSVDEVTARALVATLSNTRDVLEVVSVAPEYLSTGSWYLFADPEDFPVILRGTLSGHDGQSLSWGSGELREGDAFGSLRMDAIHSVGYAAVSRCGAVRIDMA